MPSAEAGLRARFGPEALLTRVGAIWLGKPEAS